MGASGLDVLGESVVGVDWADVGRQAAGGVHTAGKVVLSTFGQKELGQKLENLEAGAGILPDWARTAAPTAPGAPARTGVAPGAPAAPPSTPKERAAAVQREQQAARAHERKKTLLYVGAGVAGASVLGLVLWGVLR